jgi:hypothetical protein
VEPTKRSLEKFKALYQKHFGETLTDEEVLRKALYFIEVYRVAYGMPTIGDNVTEETGK